MTTPGRVVVEPFDSSVLIDIWLDGFVSGAASHAMLMLPTPAADRVAEQMVTSLQADPAAMESVRNEVLERLRGIEGEAHNVSVHVNPDHPGGDTRG